MCICARENIVYIYKVLEALPGVARCQGQKSTRKGDTEMERNNTFRIVHVFEQEINEKINKETMNRYGIERQSLVAMEELSELQKAISKLVRNSEEKTKSLEFKGLRHNLIEEMADVIICMDQLKEYYNINHAEIQSIIASKQARQAKRLEEE